MLKDKLQPMCWSSILVKEKNNNPQAMWKTPLLLISWQSLPSKDAFMNINTLDLQRDERHR